MAEPNHPENDEAPPKRRGPRCPNCGATMQPGTVRLSARTIDFAFTGWASYSLYFHPLEGKRREVMEAGEEKGALRCPICNGLWIH
ncbi:MAG TPA: hypothetical protein VHG91_05180 [Longimicrobium sp.]|nr:hypothetical protein [Longimicrobium sp.]